jgi:cellobiose phosphorylase
VHADYRGALDEAPLPQLSTPAPVPPDAVGADTANADRIARSLLASAQPLAGTDLRPAELEVLAGTGRAVERDATGAPLSWFDAADADAPARHTATGTKERLVARPHGAILLSADALEPAIPQLTATTWAGGVFAAHLAFGNTNEHRVLGIHRGVRILVRGRGGDGDAGWNRLTVPSLWESDLGRTRWTYRILGGTLTVTTTIGSGTPALALTVDTDLDVDLRLVLELDPDGEDWEVVQRDTRTLSVTSSQRRAAYLLEGTGDWADDAELWEDGTARDRATWVLAPSSADGARVTFAAGTDPVEAAATLAATGDTDPADWASAHHRAIGRLTRDLRLPADGPYAEFDLLVPWFAHDALVHLLAPHGLEQSSGAAWGTRDVCQGPFEFALAFGHLDACRDLLLRIFAHQLPSGDWPQWFMYDEYRDIHAPDSHGDVAVWPLVALAEYLQASGDLSVLDETVPYLDAPIEDEYPIRNHLQRQLDHLDSHRVPGSALPAYGHGDWDDTLQPADDSLRDSMASTWTAALLAGVTRDLGALLESSDRAIAERLHTTAEALGGLLRGELLVDGVMPGFVRLVDGETIPVIHPRDETTGLHYRLISLTQGVLSGVLGADAAEAQIRTVGERLLAPDGAHLMDRPVAWHEGRTTLFRRAEQSAFFGREVGLMYTHAHLRWVETLAAWGRGDALEQLLQISPVGIGERLGDRALPRQRNCYYSSSDAAFPTRDEASAEWDRVSAGEVDVAGGWRIYSSGPGIVLRVLVQDLLGVRLHGDEVVLDPLLPEGSDRTKFTIAVAEDGPALAVEVQRDPSAVPGSVRVTVDDRAVETRPVTGAYRDRGVAVPASALEGVGRIEARVG